jgi:hypothetical protein
MPSWRSAVPGGKEMDGAWIFAVVWASSGGLWCGLCYVFRVFGVNIGEEFSSGLNVLEKVIGLVKQGGGYPNGVTRAAWMQEIFEKILDKVVEKRGIVLHFADSSVEYYR